MTSVSIGTLFAGIGGSEFGAIAACHANNITPVLKWAVEADPAIAHAHCMNHSTNTITAKVQDVEGLEYVDLLLASPVCKSFSIANHQGKEHAGDIAAAMATARIIDEVRPRWAVIENVLAYRDSQSYRLIRDRLAQAGYTLLEDVLKCADYGVPQTRKRFIVRAIRPDMVKGIRPYIAQTHAKDPAPLLMQMGAVRPWVSWYEAIADLLPDCPDSALVPWQLRALPDWVHEWIKVADDDAIAVGNQTQHPVIQKSDPAWTVRSSCSTMPRAILISGGNSSGTAARRQDDPAYTVAASKISSSTRALLIPKVGARLKDGVFSDRTLRQQDQPAPTIRALGRAQDNHWEQFNALLLERGAQVKALTPQCDARLQTFPDSVWLPERKCLACEMVGNAVPPKFMQAIVENLIKRKESL